MNDFHLLIAKWYRQNGRNLPWRETTNPYFIWLSEIILQQTRVDQGMNYYHRFVTNYPTVSDLARATEQQVLNDWQGLGYYSRARNLHSAAKYITTELNGNFPESHEQILRLKGVGTYTAAAISSFAFNEKKAVVDGNVYRVLSRVFDISTPIDSTEGKKEFQQLADELISEKSPGEHNQAIMELGALICKPTNPNCEDCPVNLYCFALKNNSVQARPVKTKKTKVRDRYFHFLIFETENQIIIEQRTEKDIWQNMYQFPLLEDEATLFKIELEKTYESKPIKHVLSHQHIYATFHHFKGFPKQLKKSWKLIERSNLDDYPFPRLIDKYLSEYSQ